MAGDVVRVREKGDEAFWGFLPDFHPIAIEGHAGDRVRVLWRVRERSRAQDLALVLAPCTRCSPAY